MRTIEHGSLTAAARHLGISTAVVSYRLGILEQNLGCRLLSRTTREVAPTDIGKQFYGHCLNILHAVANARACVDDVACNPQGALTLTAPLVLGRRLIAPMMSTFGAQYPRLEVKLKITDHILNLQPKGVDLAIRLANFEDSSLTQRKIATVRRGFFASPKYIEAHGMPRSPRDLHSHKCLVLNFPGSPQARWSFREGAKSKCYDVAGPMHSDDSDVLTDWAVASEGIVLKPFFEVADHLKSSRLVSVMEDHPPPDVTLGILYPTNRMLPVWTRSLIELIVEKGREHVSSAMRDLDANSSAQATDATG